MTDEEKKKRCFEIIKENLSLPNDVGIIEFCTIQDELIKEYCSLGHTKDDFYRHSRVMANIEDL